MLEVNYLHALTWAEVEERRYNERNKGLDPEISRRARWAAIYLDGTKTRLATESQLNGHDATKREIGCC